MNNSLFVHQMWETSDAQLTAIKSVKHYKKVEQTERHKKLEHKNK